MFFRTPDLLANRCKQCVVGMELGDTEGLWELESWFNMFLSVSLPHPDCEPEEVSDWSFDENCLFCCLRREKVKVGDVTTLRPWASSHGVNVFTVRSWWVLSLMRHVLILGGILLHQLACMSPEKQARPRAKSPQSTYCDSLLSMLLWSHANTVIDEDSNGCINTPSGNDALVYTVYIFSVISCLS